MFSLGVGPTERKAMQVGERMMRGGFVVVVTGGGGIEHE